MGLSTARQRRVKLVVAGRDFGVWDEKTGGGADSEESKYAQGDMGPQQAHTMSKSRSNVELVRGFDDLRDIVVGRELDRLIGQPAVVTEVFLDATRAPVGDPFVYTGKLKAVQLPDHDSNSTDVSKLQCEVSADAEMG